MDFYKRMGAVCRHIPKGMVATYGQIAYLCGKPRNARQVGHGLKFNLAGEQLPAHRVVNSQGVLSGACNFITWDLQKMLLENEGVNIFWSPAGWRVDLKIYGWKNTPKEAEELNQFFNAYKM